MPNQTLLIDADTRDLVFDADGNFAVIEDADTVAQCVRDTLRVYRGEFRLMPGHGTDYATVFGDTHPSDDEILDILREAIYQETDIGEVRDMSIRDTGRGRVVVFTAVTVGGSILTQEVALA